MAKKKGKIRKKWENRKAVKVSDDDHAVTGTLLAA